MNTTIGDPPSAPKETDRVRAKSSPALNEKIDDRTIEYLCHYVEQPVDALSRRIQELDQEWDIERWLEANAAGLALGGVILGAAGNRRWLILPGLVLPFLLLHAVHGWCPPVPVLRRFGVRTRREIDSEKFALKVLRGDFEGIPAIMDETLRAVEAFIACRE